MLNPWKIRNSRNILSCHASALDKKITFGCFIFFPLTQSETEPEKYVCHVLRFKICKFQLSRYDDIRGSSSAGSTEVNDVWFCTFTFYSLHWFNLSFSLSSSLLESSVDARRHPQHATLLSALILFRSLPSFYVCFDTRVTTSAQQTWRLWIERNRIITYNVCLNCAFNFLRFFLFSFINFLAAMGHIRITCYANLRSVGSFFTRCAAVDNLEWYLKPKLLFSPVLFVHAKTNL